MRIANAAMCVILIAFAAVQYNDPDALLWIGVYAGGAFWCAVATFRPEALARGPVLALLGATIAAAAAGVVVWWPQADRFWMEEVWWNTETAREGMGMMIDALALLLVAATALASRRRHG